MGQGKGRNAEGPGQGASAFLDANALIRHLTGDPPDLAERATTFLAQAEELLLPDPIVAEMVYVLESFHELPPGKVAELVQTVIGFDSIRTLDPALLLRALEVYVIHRLDFAEAYLVASAESAGVNDSRIEP